MSIQNATAIVQRLGPCRIAIDRETHPELACELALLGCVVTDVPTTSARMPRQRGTNAGFLAWAEADTGAGFARALSAFGQMDMLVLQSAGQDRQGLEQTIFAAGWQRHPGGMTVGDYGSWTAGLMPGATIWQRGKGGDHSLLTQGVTADPIIARYAAAAQHVRPGDRILLDGMAPTDGAAILMALSRAGSVIDAATATIADNAVDLVVALEPADGSNWIDRLDDYARMLKHDGRVVIGCTQGRGEDGRPTGWDSFIDAVAERFLPEQRYIHIPVSPNPAGPHAIFPVEPEQAAATEWLMIVASANPLIGAAHPDGYDNPAFPAARGPLPALVDFGAAYDNPWLYRTMVQMGERLTHDVKLARLAECVIEDSREDSADRGAAIAVLGYRVLEMRRPDLALAILPMIQAYTDRPLAADMPVHVRRWRISLAFLAGRLSELAEDRDAAKRWYREAAMADWADFSPLLATKTIAASFYEARIHLADGDPQTALACFRHGADTALKAAAFPHDQQMGADGEPLPFYLQELAEVIDMGSQCANALAHFSLWQRDPGLFWRQVDVRRFGLASWARDLERENAQLRAA